MSEFKYNELQERLLSEFIDRGGRFVTSPSGIRGAGYSTFVAVQCLQQALTTGRNVTYIYDGHHDNQPHEMCSLAVRVFGATPSWDRRRGIIRLGDLGEIEIRIMQPRRYGDSLRGRQIDDVFVDVSGETMRDNYEFFETLRVVQERSSIFGDGPGLLLMVIR